MQIMWFHCGIRRWIVWKCSESKVRILCHAELHMRNFGQGRPNQPQRKRLRFRKAFPFMHFTATRKRCPINPQVRWTCQTDALHFVGQRYRWGVDLACYVSWAFAQSLRLTFILRPIRLQRAWVPTKYIIWWQSNCEICASSEASSHTLRRWHEYMSSHLVNSDDPNTMHCSTIWLWFYFWFSI